MNPTLFHIFFAATAPVALMPSVIALLTRNRRRAVIVSLNVLLWGLIYFTARGFTIGGSGAFRLPTVLALAGWLVLLGYAVRSAPSTRRP